ncbi:MAG TPA: hypothetical protein DDW50_08300, partial [Firmicutes bacterium]|nr:hypothetical protein [Bacillota bacterium]
IQRAIFQLPAEDDELKDIVTKDVELAVEYSQGENILGTINTLAVVVTELHTYLLKAPGLFIKINPILKDIHYAQQLLIRKPVEVIGATGPEGCPGPVGYSGATGATGPEGCPGPVGYSGATGSTGPSGITTFVSTSTIPIIPIKKPESMTYYTFICRADRR